MAEKSGVRVEIDRSGALLEEYYQLYLLSIDRWAERQHEPRPWPGSGPPSDPLSKLRAMSEHLGKSFVVTLAYVDDRPAFGSITLLGQTAHDTRAAMDRDLVDKTYAGDLVQWRMIELACELGCTAYHLGETGQLRVSRAVQGHRKSFPPQHMHAMVISGIRPSFPSLSRSAGQITHVLLTRSPLEYPEGPFRSTCMC